MSVKSAIESYSKWLGLVERMMHDWELSGAGYQD